MYWVYKNLLFFFINKNFLYKNFFLLNYFNYYLINLKIEKTLLIKNNFTLGNNYKNKLVFSYARYFNDTIIFKNNLFKKNNLNILFNYKNNNICFLNKNNLFFLKNFINLIYLINSENNNFLILDKYYKNIFPLYNLIFGFNNLLIYKKYFFIKSSFFSYRRWDFMLINFFRKFKIILLIILNYSYFFKFFKNLKALNLPISSLLEINSINYFIDYPIFVKCSLDLEKFIFLNLITQSFLLAFNYKNYKNKLIFLNLFYIFSTKLN